MLSALIVNLFCLLHFFDRQHLSPSFSTSVICRHSCQSPSVFHFSSNSLSVVILIYLANISPSWPILDVCRHPSHFSFPVAFLDSLQYVSHFLSTGVCRQPSQSPISILLLLNLCHLSHYLSTGVCRISRQSPLFVACLVTCYMLHFFLISDIRHITCQSLSAAFLPNLRLSASLPVFVCRISSQLLSAAFIVDRYLSTFHDDCYLTHSCQPLHTAFLVNRHLLPSFLISDTHFSPSKYPSSVALLVDHCLSNLMLTVICQLSCQPLSAAFLVNLCYVSTFLSTVVCRIFSQPLSVACFVDRFLSTLCDNRCLTHFLSTAVYRLGYRPSPDALLVNPLLDAFPL